MKSKVIVIGIVLVIGVFAGVYLASPLLINTVVDEPFPSSLSSVNSYSEFMNMNETDRVLAAQSMNQTQIDNIMIDAAKVNESVNEAMPSASMFESPDISLTGIFEGVGDGIHDASGEAQVIVTQNGDNILRFEDFKSTNGPDLYVYLSTDTTDSDIVDLGRLKGNIGNQNYLIPPETNLDKYDTVLIWCKAFSVLFGSAKLT